MYRDEWESISYGCKGSCIAVALCAAADGYQCIVIVSIISHYFIYLFINFVSFVCYWLVLFVSISN